MHDVQTVPAPLVCRGKGELILSTDITIVCPPSAANAINTALNINPFLTALPHPRPDLLAPEGLDNNTGTADILRLPEVRNVLTSDFVVLPCDLVCELGGDKLLQAWMVRAAAGPLDGSTRGSGGMGVWYETKSATPVKGEETDFIATSPFSLPTTVPAPKDSLLSNLSKLVLSMPTDSRKDITEERKGFPMRHGLMRKHPRVKILTTHRDAHIYIFPRWIVDFVAENPRLESIGEDVVGWWAKAGWQDGLPEKLSMRKAIMGPAEPSEETPDSPALQERSPEGSPTRRAPKKEAPFTVPPLLAYVHPSAAPVVRRVDTAPLLLAVSLQLAKLPSVEEAGAEASPYAHNRKVAYPEGVKPRTTITRQDSLVADNVMVEEKTSIKECVIGANCQIKEGAKLFQCLLMDGVVVGKGCKLTRCILGKRSEIGEATTLTDCEVQENLLVEPKSKFAPLSLCIFPVSRRSDSALTKHPPPRAAEEKDTKLMSSEGLEATEQEIDDVLQDAEDEDDDDDDMEDA